MLYFQLFIIVCYLANKVLLLLDDIKQSKYELLVSGKVRLTIL